MHDPRRMLRAVAVKAWLCCIVALGCGPSETFTLADARPTDAAQRADARLPDASSADAMPADAMPSDALPADADPVDADPGDITAPLVESTTPGDTETAVAPNAVIVVTFSEPMAPSTITTNTADLSCSGTLQVSRDAFATCLQMTAAPTSGDDTSFQISPSAGFASATPYRIRVTTGAQDVAGNALDSAYESATGFKARYFHSMVIDANNNFVVGTEGFAASTVGAQLFVSFDSDTLYLALTHADIVVGGSGNKFVYFFFSTDESLATGNPLSSDGKAKFGAAGTKSFTHHWKSQIDGTTYNEFRIGDGTDWTTDWGASGKLVSRSVGLIEASIALSEFGGAPPATLAISSYTIDYDGASNDGWLYNMLNGGTDGSGAAPRDLAAYVQLSLPTSLAPNDIAHLRAF